MRIILQDDSEYRTHQNTAVKFLSLPSGTSASFIIKRDRYTDDVEVIVEDIKNIKSIDPSED